MSRYSSFSLEFAIVLLASNLKSNKLLKLVDCSRISQRWILKSNNYYKKTQKKQQSFKIYNQVSGNFKTN